MGKYWIAALKDTCEIATSEGFLWSPQKDIRGYNNKGYTNMLEANVGDIIFAYKKRFIKDIGIVTQACFSQRTPPYSVFKTEWPDQDGYTLQVEWLHLKNEIDLHKYKAELNLIESELPDNELENRPFVWRTKKETFGKHQEDVTFSLKQQYLVSVCDEYARFFLEKLPDGRNNLETFLCSSLFKSIAQIDPSVVIESTTKEALVKIRTAQSDFIRNVLKVEDCCRVTKIPQIAQLIVTKCYSDVPKVDVSIVLLSAERG
ncbi:hypothetical protein DKL61_04645 [Gammaproteobacteria bacterium ESL0073]|nr:hypothetical protein DKL61_04645 [Gammaproteobacteria bacterium ESL0073]